jgi:hypothetical protein
MCVNGMCMVPAPREPAPAAPAAQPPPPAQPPQTPPPSEAAPPAAEPAPAAAPAPPIYSRPAPAPRPTAPPPLVPRLREGHVFMPFIGLHSFQDSNSSGVDAGLRLGTFLGAFTNNDFSVNGAVTFDVMNPNSKADPLEISAQMLELTFSPLFHLGSPQVEFIVGPKLGFWNMWSHVRIPVGVLGPTQIDIDGTTQGWTVGGNMGLLVAATPGALVGVILNLEVRDIIHSCGTATGMPEECDTSGDSSTILGFSFATLL